MGSVGVSEAIPAGLSMGLFIFSKLNNKRYFPPSDEVRSRQKPIARKNSKYDIDTVSISRARYSVVSDRKNATKANTYHSDFKRALKSVTQVPAASGGDVDGSNDMMYHEALNSNKQENGGVEYVPPQNEYQGDVDYGEDDGDVESDLEHLEDDLAVDYGDDSEIVVASTEEIEMPEPSDGITTMKANVDTNLTPINNFIEQEETPINDNGTLDLEEKDNELPRSEVELKSTFGGGKIKETKSASTDATVTPMPLESDHTHTITLDGSSIEALKNVNTSLIHCEYRDAMENAIEWILANGKVSKSPTCTTLTAQHVALVQTCNLSGLLFLAHIVDNLVTKSKASERGNELGALVDCIESEPFERVYHAPHADLLEAHYYLLRRYYGPDVGTITEFLQEIDVYQDFLTDAWASVLTEKIKTASEHGQRGRGSEVLRVLDNIVSHPSMQPQFLLWACKDMMVLLDAPPIAVQCDRCGVSCQKI